jgi:sRNA-binding regulator protein Hfq
MKRANFLIRNALSITFFLLMLFSIGGQIYTGWKEHNDFLNSYNQPGTSISVYLASGHFLQATFENWESEFFQMALFVILTVFMKQEGSSESRPMEEEPTDKEGECEPLKNSPWPVKKGGFALLVYKHSLSIVLILLFFLSFGLHWYGSFLDYNEQQALEGLPLTTGIAYLGYSKFWFESFQNWQSEFLSIFAIIFLSIYLRQAGSSQSKKVNAPHSETGE